MSPSWGRFTARGGPELEARIAKWMQEAADRMQAVLAPREYRSVVLLGGYGRGEGGVERRAKGEFPHNNFDLLVLATVPRRKIPGLKARVQEALAPLAAECGIGLDIGVISHAGLLRSPCLVMWYDMRHGHKTLLGDPQALSSLERFRRDRIVPDDVRNLLVNRGTLLVINDVLREQGGREEDLRRTLVRHAVKAVIGFGDALLFFLGDYHWSYCEKQKRMREQEGISASFRRLYDQAMEFRFEPDYVRFPGCELDAWSDRLRAELEPVHLLCESLRLRRPGLRWEDYGEAAFHSVLGEGLRHPLRLARGAKGLLSGRNGLPARTLRARLGLRLSRARDRLSILFPVVAYDLAVPALRRLACREFGAAGEDLPSLRRAYLRSWGTHGDVNFAAMVRKLGISLEDAPR
ncbi:MAG: hypothetical protein ACE5H3_01280 [Planctomycetota bacterium]